MSRLSAKVLLLLTAMSGIASSACQSGGVGDPCIPEDEYNANFSGYSETEVNVESRSFQCETRVCLVANFRGRVSCPFGQKAATMPDSTGKILADPNLAPDDRCYFPGTKEAQANQIAVPVDSQLVARSPDKAVYCSCRCDGPDKNAQYCDCPSGYSCQKLIDAYGTSGGAQLAGSYCIKDGTEVQDPTQLTNTTRCSDLPPAQATLPPPKGCGPKHPAGLVP
ncbi:MAG TPA: hypothetical protein VHC69_01155 [Polyangiaceae bacterium]|nr:hypothetical protein [Polyangiaceae bacterium]